MKELPLDKNFKGIRVLIFGLGLNGGGVDAALWFAKHGANVTITDIKTYDVLRPSIKKLGNYKYKFFLGEHKESLIKESDLIIQNPGVANDSPFIKLARKMGIPIHNSVSVFLRYCPANVIGITGTRGKSTTTYLAWMMLKKKHRKAAIGGTPEFGVLKQLDKLKGGGWIVLELSSWQLEFLAQVKKSPSIAVITNIYEDHLNRYKDLDSYIDAKWNIFRYQDKNGAAILNADNLELMNKFKANNLNGEVYMVSKDRGVEKGTYLSGDKIIYVDDDKKEILFCLKDIKKAYLSLGEHNLYNLLTSSCIVRHIGVGISAIKNTAKTFSGLPGRQELLRKINGVEYYNDTTSTTPIACIQALNTLGSPRGAVLIAGGVDKNLSYGNLIKIIKKKVKTLILLPGSASAKIVDGLKKERFKNEIILTKNLVEAMEIAKKFSKRGDRVIFSPAAASFNLFLNEFDRGDKFKKLVMKL